MDGVELLHILSYTSENVRIVSSQHLKFNTVNSQRSENQHGQRSKRLKELVKVLTCGCSRDHRVCGSDIPLMGQDIYQLFL